MGGGYGDQLVRLDATLAAVSQYTEEQTFTLMADGLTFYGHLENPRPPPCPAGAHAPTDGKRLP